MKKFNIISAVLLVVIVSVIFTANMIIKKTFAENFNEDRPYIVEVSRTVQKIERDGLENIDFSSLEYITDIQPYCEKFYESNSDYVIREINGELYRFSYVYHEKYDVRPIIMTVNIFLVIMSVIVMGVMLFVNIQIIAPFSRFSEVPYELSKGNLTIPLKENKNRFFGSFVWGIDLLRESIEEQKKRELDLQRDKKTLLLSLSHDIKTPLSAIKLYAKALSRGLYSSAEKQAEIAENINEKADEIENFLTQIIDASREDFVSIDVRNGEFYIGEMIENIRSYYDEKMKLNKTVFTIENYENFLVKGDIDRGVEVLQNVIENAIKYGDGKEIAISFSEEDGCALVSVRNSGCTLSGAESVHIFESFWRGSNAERVSGSGLGLYICRQIMHKMNGEIFADVAGDEITVTAVFGKV